MLAKKQLIHNKEKGDNMSDSYDIERLKIILNKPMQEFQKTVQDNSEDLFAGMVYFQKDENIDRVIRAIKDNELKDEQKNILHNLLQLEPFSSKIIDEFINSDFLNSSDFIVRVDKVREVSSHILNSLQKQKLKIRKEKNDSSKVEADLKDVLKELNKYQDILDKTKRKQNEEKKITTIKREIAKIEKELKFDNVDELEKILNDYRDKKKEILEISKEIVNSKDLIKNLPKDKSLYGAFI